MQREKTLPIEWDSIPSPSRAADDANTEDSLELMKCPICLDVQFRTVTALPCLHEACSPCAYKHSTTASNPSRFRCPICKSALTQWRVNHTQRQRIEVFLQQHPEHRRSKQDLHALETAPQVPTEGLRVPCLEGSPGASDSHEEGFDVNVSPNQEGQASQARVTPWQANANVTSAGVI